MRLGFSACGVTDAAVVDADTRRIYEKYVAEGRIADMNYLANYPDLRFDPTQLLPGCRTIICVALSYYPRTPLPDDTYQIAYYAYGRDYHEVMREKLVQLVNSLAAAAGITDPSTHFRSCTDTAPMLERYWAVRSGIGFIGRNHTLIVPRLGSYFFLSEVLTTIKCDNYQENNQDNIHNNNQDNNQENNQDSIHNNNQENNQENNQDSNQKSIQANDPLHIEARHGRESVCSSCHRCIDACPTGALRPDGTFDARRCLSYLTIEHRGPFTPEQAAMVGSQPTPYYIYGCDRCQRCCPHNQRAVPTTEPLFLPNQQLYTMTPARWQQLTREQYQVLFSHSAVKRAKYEGLMRNIECVS